MHVRRCSFGRWATFVLWEYISFTWKSQAGLYAVMLCLRLWLSHPEYSRKTGKVFKSIYRQNKHWFSFILLASKTTDECGWRSDRIFFKKKSSIILRGSYEGSGSRRPVKIQSSIWQYNQVLVIGSGLERTTWNRSRNVSEESLQMRIQIEGRP